MKKIVTIALCAVLSAAACSNTNEPDASGNKPGIYTENLSEQNLLRAMEIVDNAVSNYFSGTTMTMARYYNPYTDNRSAEKGSIWMYTSSIEAVNAVMHALKAQKENGNPALYDAHFNRYAELLAQLYENAAYYQGTYTLVSYTQTKEWTVYGVDRGNGIGTAEVEGIKNVYDDQMWLIRELIEAYKLTGKSDYLTQAEYLTDYVLDGWDCSLDAEGKENGGITWGPGYVTKHSCSNGPMVSPLVWLHELYKDKADQITYGCILADNSRSTKTAKKSDYYLEFAKKVYDYQKTHLMRPDGVYDDMMGGDDSGGQIVYETVDGVRYRKHTSLRDRVGPAISYNSGTMISGAADLYRATKENVYLDDLKKLSDASFNYFAKLDATVSGHYTYAISGFNNWFNNVLMRGWVDAYAASQHVAPYIDTFQQNLDYGYENFLREGMLPTNLLVGWNRETGKNNTEGMFTFAFAAEYAVLSKYELEKN